jgi:hypothetical protein
MCNSILLCYTFTYVDLCTQPQREHTHPISCPVELGTYQIVQTVELPKEGPKHVCLFPPFHLYHSISCYHLPRSHCTSPSLPISAKCYVLSPPFPRLSLLAPACHPPFSSSHHPIPLPHLLPPLLLTHPYPHLLQTEVRSWGGLESGGELEFCGTCFDYVFFICSYVISSSVET